MKKDMEIIEYTWKPSVVLIDMLKRVRLLNPKVFNGFIYKDAEITIENVNISDILPAQFYILKDGVKQAKVLSEEFKKLNVDIYNLNGFIKFTMSNGEERCILPPIIEYQEEYCGCRYPILVDGTHRVYTGIEEGITQLQVICIRNVPRELPVPSYANYLRWDDITLMDKPPASSLKKSWRVSFSNAYDYYRNFDDVFPGIGKPRSKGMKANGGKKMTN